jgi:hypothetical protein
MEKEFGIQPRLQIEESINVDERKEKWRKKWKKCIFKRKTGGVKAHYSGQNLLSQIVHFETSCIWTSTKLILNFLFANSTWNKVVQNPKNKIVKKNPTLRLILNDWKVY